MKEYEDITLSMKQRNGAVRITVTKTVSMPEEMLIKALKRSAAQDRTFSNYVRSLLAKDFGEDAQPKEKEAA